MLNHQLLWAWPGLGDLVLTCTDNQSRNRRFGLALGHGGAGVEQAIADIGQVVEGYRNTKEVYLCWLNEWVWKCLLLSKFTRYFIVVKMQNLLQQIYCLANENLNDFLIRSRKLA